MFSAHYDSPLGQLTMASEGQVLRGVWLQGQRYFAQSVSTPFREAPALELFGQARAWLDRYFAGARPDPTELPLQPVGSDFRQQVWQLLLEIPYGQTLTYGDLARTIAQQRGTASVSAQAVGGAVGHNPISIIIPCHRVMGARGALTGYAGGVAKKVALLRHEGVAVAAVGKSPSVVVS